MLLFKRLYKRQNTSNRSENGRNSTSASLNNITPEVASSGGGGRSNITLENSTSLPVVRAHRNRFATLSCISGSGSGNSNGNSNVNGNDSNGEDGRIHVENNNQFVVNRQRPFLCRTPPPNYHSLPATPPPSYATHQPSLQELRQTERLPENFTNYNVNNDDEQQQEEPPQQQRQNITHQPQQRQQQQQSDQQQLLSLRHFQAPEALAQPHEGGHGALNRLNFERNGIHEPVVVNRRQGLSNGRCATRNVATVSQQGQRHNYQQQQQQQQQQIQQRKRKQRRRKLYLLQQQQQQEQQQQHQQQHNLNLGNHSTDSDSSVSLTDASESDNDIICIGSTRDQRRRRRQRLLKLRETSTDLPLAHTSSDLEDCGDEMTEGKNVPNTPQPSCSADVPFRRGGDFRKSSLSLNRLVGVIDEGTNTVSFSIYTTPEFKEIASHRIEKQIITVKDGWFEQDAIAIINNIYRCCEVAVSMLPPLGYRKEDIFTIGITNQRETTVVWDSMTGKPLYNAIVWNDIRTNTTVDQILAKVPEQNKNHFKNIVGLPVSTYFSALKIRWLKDNVASVRKACREKRCKAGTIDSWIVWNLTKGALHITDVTNASRTMLMNIETLEWDPVLLKTFSIHIDMLPDIRSCSEIYGKVFDDRSVLKGMPISGILGNQQASLLGQMCIKPGQTKNTYRSGCFLLCNTGTTPVISSRGLLTTVAYKLGKDMPAVYALEGAVAVAGHALEWLQNKVRIVPKASDAEQYAEAVLTTGDVYFVPAFTGLYAPYWRKDARGLIIGLTQFSNKHHIVRAALEAICFQSRDILECIYKEGGFKFNKLHADGALSSNNVLMQLQADTAGVPVFRSQLLDSTAFGAAMCAAQAEGIELCKFDPHKRHYDNIYYDTFLPTSTDEERAHRYGKWKKAVERSFDWAEDGKPKLMTQERYRMLSSVPVGLFLISTFAMLVHSLRNAKP